VAQAIFGLGVLGLLLVMLEPLIGLWTAVGWLVAVGVIQRVVTGLARVVSSERGDRTSILPFCTVYAAYMAAYAAVAVPLWNRGGHYGGAIATALLAAGLLRAILETRGSRATLLGAVPIAGFLVAGPLVAVQFSGAAAPPAFYWFAVLFIVASSLAWARELARLDRRNAEALEEAERRRRQAESATAAKSAFINMVSHELRTPISGVLAASADLENSDDEHVRQRGELVADAARLMRTLLNDLLDLAKIEAGRMTVENVAYDLGGTIRQARRLYESDASAKGLQLNLKGDEALPQVVGDPTRTRQILNNLLSNAIKFTDEGVIEVDVRCEPTSEDRMLVQISVKDSGRGMSPEQLARLFRPFDQTDASVARTHGGTGLGLTISRDLARLMGGDILVNSREGFGSTFSVTIDVGDGAQSADIEPTLPSAPLDINRLNVFAADDHEVNRRVIALLLEPLGAKVDFAENGEEALERLALRPYDLVLMDVHMPKVDGLEAMRLLRSREGPNRYTPVLAVTGSGAPDDIAACLQAGADGHVLKPLDPAALQSAVAEVLRPRAMPPKAAVGSG